MVLVFTYIGGRQLCFDLFVFARFDVFVYSRIVQSKKMI